MDAARQGLLEFAGSEEAAQQMAESAARDAQAELARVRAENRMSEAPAPVVPNLDGLSLIQKRKAQQEAERQNTAARAQYEQAKADAEARIADAEHKAQFWAEMTGMVQSAEAREQTPIVRYDHQGNPIDEKGNFIVEVVSSVDEIADEEFVNPHRTVQLPELPKNVADAIGTEGKPVIIKKNIFGKNRDKHNDLTPKQSREILKAALYSPNLYGKNQAKSRPANWILIQLAGKNSAVIIEVDHNKNNCEIVNWHYIGPDAIERKKRRAVEEGGRILTLESAAANTQDNSSSDGKGNTSSSNIQEGVAESSIADHVALSSMPEWHNDKPADARARGMRRYQGEVYTRQQPVQGVVGKEIDVKFSNKEKPTGRVVVMEASQLQPSHLQGAPNPMHFIDEAQPKDRNDNGVSATAEQEIAEKLNHEEITVSATAYGGAPVVNTRGEVIQGNNRSDALRYLWENNLPEQQAAYKQYLIDNAERFGLDPDAVANMQHPVLVTMLDVTDGQAITLGQKTQKDIESGGFERIKPTNVARTLGERMSSFANMLMQTSDEEMSLSQLLDKNGLETLKWLRQIGAITETEYMSARDSKGDITAEAKNDLTKVLYQAVFDGAPRQLEEMFGKLPAKAQRAILGTAFRDMNSPDAGKILHEVQASISAYNELMQQESFIKAKKKKQVLTAIDDYTRSYAMNDRLEQVRPSDNFSNFALHLAGLYKAGDVSQKTITSYFNQMYDYAQGKMEQNLFEKADTTKYTLPEIVKKVLEIDYKPAENGTSRNTTVVSSDNRSQEGQPRSTGSPEGGERTPQGAESSERRGRTPKNSIGGGVESTRKPAPLGVTEVAEPRLDEGASRVVAAARAAGLDVRFFEDASGANGMYMDGTIWVM